MPKKDLLPHTSYPDILIRSRTERALWLALCMIAGLLCSRALLSVSMILFGANAILGVPLRAWLRQSWWIFGLVWIGFYAASWFWSDDTAYWLVRVQTKLPFLLLPLAFGLLPAFSSKQIRLFTTCFSLLILAGMGYSIFMFLLNPAHYISGYRFSHIMPTPAYGDHINFSMLLALSVLWILYVLPFFHRRTGKILLVVLAASITVYLHLLAAKTGLAALYTFLLLYGGYLVISRRRRLTGIIVLLLLLTGFLSAMWYIPTFRSRVDYTLYSVKQYRTGNISSDYSDIGRVISYDLALQLIAAHPWLGVGAGDIHSEMSRAYDKAYPDVPDTQKLVPHNQFLIIGVATGLISLSCFILWTIAPLRRLRRDRDSFYFLACWLMLSQLLLVNPTLEIQNGIFVYLFFLLLQRHMLLHRPVPRTA